MPLKLVPRTTPLPLGLWAAPLLALGATLVFGVVLFAAIGKDPLATLHAFLIMPLGNRFALSEVMLTALPLGLMGLGLAVGFRANVWNLGAEGQFILGAIGGGAVALALWRDGVPGTFLLVCLVGALAGAAFAAIPALLRTRFNASELLTSLLLVYIAEHLLGWLVQGPLRNPAGSAIAESRVFSPEATMPLLLAGTRLHWGWLVLPLAAAGVWFLMRRTVLGFQLRATGDAPVAAAYAGFSQTRAIWVCFLLTGALAGLVGAMEVAGPTGQLLPRVSPGYGFAAIVVAFLGRLSPVGMVLAAHVVALVLIGGEMVQMVQDVPAAVALLFQGVLLGSLLAAEVLTRYRVVRLHRSAEVRA